MGNRTSDAAQLAALYSKLDKEKRRCDEREMEQTRQQDKLRKELEEVRAVRSSDAAQFAALHAELRLKEKLASVCDCETQTGDQASANITNGLVVHRSDLDNGSASCHQILIECPGACATDINIKELSNGVAVSIAGAENPVPRQVFAQEFRFDENDGLYELRIDECGLDKGILQLILKQRPPHHYKLASIHPVQPSNATEHFIGSSVATDDDVLGSVADSWVLESMSIAAGAVMSDTSDTALSEVGSSVKCYLPNTAFKSPDGHLLPVQSLGVGSQVLLSTGQAASVVALHRYPSDKYKLVELATRHGSIRVSEKHRIPVANGSTPLEHRQANSLQVGDQVYVGQRVQRLTKVHKTEERVEMFMISFQPDQPVEAFAVPQCGLLTQGEPLRPSMLNDISEADLVLVAPALYEE